MTFCTIHFRLIIWYCAVTVYTNHMRVQVKLKTAKMILILLFTANVIPLSVAEVFHVTPTLPATQPCPPPCHTLDQYAQNTSLFAGHTNISLVILDGDHNLTYSLHLTELRQLDFSGQETTMARIYLLSVESFLVLEDIVAVRLSNIMFIGNELGTTCRSLAEGRNATYMSKVTELVIENSRFVSEQVGLFLVEVQVVTIRSSAFTDASSFGVLMISAGNATISECTIANNQIGIIALNSNLRIQDTNLTLNALGIIVPRGRADHSTKIVNCKFEANRLIGLGLIHTNTNTTIHNCTFSENKGPPIIAYQSEFELLGKTMFERNTVDSGGGVTLFSSTVVFGTASNTQFAHNTAQLFGGAIYAVTSPPAILPAILIQVENINSPIRRTQLENSILKPAQSNCFYNFRDETAQVTFDGNKAMLGGWDIFRDSQYMENCSLSESGITLNNSVSSTLQVSSNPTRVCFCVDKTPQCSNRTLLILNTTRYPGERFTIPVALVGYNFGRVSGPVYTDVLGKDYRGVLGAAQHSQTVELTQCTMLNLTVYSKQTKAPEMLVLTAQQRFSQRDVSEVEQTLRNVYSNTCIENTSQPCTALLTTPVYLNVTLEACPLGFALNSTSRTCECDSALNSITAGDLTCTIRGSTGFITREGTVWVGAGTGEGNTDIHRYCPRDYCLSIRTEIDPRNPDGQCNSNRSGVLCGGCQAHYSLQLGGNRCIECNNSYLVLLLVFAALGILLVTVIKLLDLTVASGTVSGLIFYANVVWWNNNVLFSLQDRQSIRYHILTVPIAWINLDFGIEACFSQNLNQLTKTGLQFVFPVYIWCIAILIVLFSHYSTRATKLFGNNSVAVLATVFLLSYGKLLRNVTDVFTFANITNSNNSTRRVWLLDGNEQYGTGGHIVLIILAFLFLTLFLLPFTLILLLVPFLRAKSSRRPLHWINTLKPFFDSYYGPFKDKKQQQVWTGILLVSRVVVLIVFGSASAYNPRANILLMSVLTTFLLLYSAMVGLLYKKWNLSLLENAYLVNLIILGGVFYSYEKSVNSGLNPVATVSIVIALCQFVSTAIIYTTKRIWPRIRNHIKTRRKGKKTQPTVSARNALATDAQEIKLENFFDSDTLEESLLDTEPV